MDSSVSIRAQKLSIFWARSFIAPIIGAIAVYAQTLPTPTQGETNPLVTVDVRLVVLHASVRNRAGTIVAGLKAQNFTVLEDGRRQTIRAFHAEDSPVAVGLVVDNSGSMQRKLDGITRAAVAFARAANPSDELFVLKFNEQPTLCLPDTTLFSASPLELEQALRKPVPIGRTALYDAITRALAHLQKSKWDRKALLVMSDGSDNASKSTYQNALLDIWRSNVTMYTIGLHDELDEDYNVGVLRRIANASGGESFFPTVASDAVHICEQIARDIRTQYTISYSPFNQTFDGRRRTIQVYATGDHGERLRVRTRAGYIATPDNATERGSEESR